LAKKDPDLEEGDQKFNQSGRNQISQLGKGLGSQVAKMQRELAASKVKFYKIKYTLNILPITTFVDG